MNCLYHLQCCPPPTEAHEVVDSAGDHGQWAKPVRESRDADVTNNDTAFLSLCRMGRTLSNRDAKLEICW